LDKQKGNKAHSPKVINEVIKIKNQLKNNKRYGAEHSQHPSETRPELTKQQVSSVDAGNSDSFKIKIESADNESVSLETHNSYTRVWKRARAKDKNDKISKSEKRQFAFPILYSYL
jgi:hypothetical protein